MTTGSKFSEFLKTQIDCRAVWPPVVTPIQLGDYGVVVGGNFQKLGHVSEFGVVLEVERGEASSLNAVSQSVRTTRLAGGGPVPAFGGLGQASARLRLEFTSADAFVLKARRVERTQIRNLGALGRQLGNARTHDGQTWRHLPWRIVWQLYVGHDVVCLANRSGGTSVEFSGGAQALQQLELGKLHAGVSMHASHALGLEILGQTGPIGHGLARVKLVGGGIAFFSDGEEDDDAVECLGTDDTDDTDATDATDIRSSATWTAHRTPGSYFSHGRAHQETV